MPDNIITESTPSADFNNQTLADILTELKTLNQNFSDFTEYEKKRDSDADLKASEDEKALAEEKAAEKAAQDSQQEEADPVQGVLVDMQSMLKNIDTSLSALSGNETVDYSDTLTEISDSSEQIQLNSYFQIAGILVIICYCGLFIGSEFVKHFFRKW